MKSLSLIIALSFSLGFLASCKKNCECILPNQIEGTWHMSRVSGGLAGIDFTYNSGEVMWVFKENSDLLFVTNAIDTNDIKYNYAKLASGQYSYSTQSANGQNILFLDGMELGIYTISNNKLFIDDGVAADGLLTEFER